MHSPIASHQRIYTHGCLSEAALIGNEFMELMRHLGDRPVRPFLQELSRFRSLDTLAHAEFPQSHTPEIGIQAFSVIERAMARRSDLLFCGTDTLSTDEHWFARRRVNLLRKLVKGLPSYQPAELQWQRQRMLRLMRALLPEIVTAPQWVQLVVGPVKTIRSVRRLFDLDREPQSLRWSYDLLRCRVIVADWSEMERCFNLLLTRLMGKRFYRMLDREQIVGTDFPRLVRFFNFFSCARSCLPHGCYFRSLNLTIALDQTFAVEIQLLSRATLAYAGIDHPILIGRTCPMPDAATMNWLLAKIWQLNIVDGLSYLKAKTTHIR